MAPLIYIRDVNNLSDARYCAAMGVDLIGFRLDPSKEDSLNLAKCKEIVGWISGVKIVGEFGNSPEHIISEILEVVQVDFLLAKSVDEALQFGTYEKPLIIQAPVEKLTPGYLSKFQGLNVAYLLVTSERNSEPIPSVLELKKYAQFIIGFGITSENAASIASEKGYTGISLTGGSEERPGYKDYDEMADILDILQNF